MRKKDYDSIIEMTYTGGHLFRPYNQNSVELCDQLAIGEMVEFTVVSARDVKFHRCYFALLNFIYDYLPERFKNNIPKQHFYKWLQTLKEDYDVVFTFNDGRQLIDYSSISFGRMSQIDFENYIREQLPWIYANVLGAFFEGDQLDGIVNTIENEFDKFLSKL